MYILGISTSPRIGGNTDLLIDEVLRGAALKGGHKIEKISTAGLNIQGCTQCDACYKENRCIIQDDMGPLYPKLSAADRLIFASPIYFMGLCAQAKLLIDRCQVFWAQQHVSREIHPQKTSHERQGVFISVGATRGKAVFTGACETMKWFFRTLGLEYGGNLLFEGIEEKESIRRHPTALRDAYELGCRLG